MGETPENPALRRPAELVIRKGANLPHWTREGCTYAVTFRLADSLPQSVLKEWLIEREHIVARAAQMERELTEHELARLDELHSEKVEKFLDAGYGNCWMSRAEIAGIVHGTLFHFENVRHEIAAWCIMPNHVHAVVRPMAGFGLPEVLHAWKGFSGREANRALGLKGMFWQPESYDHLIRDGADFARCVGYVLENPRKAGLGDWRWVGTKQVP